MKTNVKMLKVKIKSLAEEAQIIRLEEKRALARTPDGKPSKWTDPDLYQGLRLHRVGVVRSEQRHSLLAYAFLRGVPYRKVEPKVGRKDQPKWMSDPDWKKVGQMVERFGLTWRATKQEKEAQTAAFDEWRKEVATV
jgi:hypothetical protein